MPLLRYFLLAGGVLLALLLLSDAYLPKSPMPESAAADLSVIRIRSAQKWPERVVFDTSSPAIGAVRIAKTDAPVVAPLVIAEATAEARVREAFAQLPPPEPKLLEPSGPRKPQAGLQTKRKVAKRRPGPPMVLVAQQPPFGFVASRIW
jgi:hypothetical protein